MSEQQPSLRSIYVKLDLRIVVVALLAVIAVMLFLWKPWQDSSPGTIRKITISGEATIDAVPDEYRLYPYFERTDSDQKAAQEELNTLAQEIIAKAKELGLSEDDVALNSDAYDQYRYYYLDAEPSTEESTVTLRVDIVARDKEKAQKMQDYLLTLDPKGQLSPIASFSEEKQKNLEAEARTKAIEDAKSKADTTAQQLGGKIGKIITVSDNSAGNIPIFSTLETRSADVSIGAEANESSLPIASGTQEINYSVTIEYELK
jgi:uncharacterized protein YggE